MAKLFVFGIGGTGARVIKALTMLLASGVKLQNHDTLVPILIDPDHANGDLTRALTLSEKYSMLRAEIYPNQQADVNGFFAQQVQTLDRLGAKTSNVTPGVYLRLDGTNNKKFGDYIGYPALQGGTKSFVELLYSQSNLDADMGVGFKGNPNMGSVVLNQFSGLSTFQHFAANFSAGDRIFIISSIFGGTGSSGFPLLLKLLRNPPERLANHGIIKDATIGALSVLPYFQLNHDGNSAIDSNSFVGKTVSALHYYQNGIGTAIDAMYYLADPKPTQYSNKEGSVEQKNQAHFIELAGALSVLDFAGVPAGLPPQHKEFGIDSNQPTDFPSLGQNVSSRFSRELSRFHLAHLYLQHYFEAVLRGGRSTFTTGIENNFLSSNFMNNLTSFRASYAEWLQEMKASSGFEPFDLSVPQRTFLDAVQGFKPSRGLFSANDLDFFNGKLNEAHKSDSSGEVPVRMLRFLHEAAEKALQERIRLT